MSTGNARNYVESARCASDETPSSAFHLDLSFVYLQWLMRGYLGDV